MKVLGVDTATATASVALVEDGRPILEEVFPHHRESRLLSTGVERANHAETLLPLIDGLLKRAGLSFSEISALAVSIGPGSFTGLRIGLSTVKGLAYGWNIPVVGVPTLLALAVKVTEWEGAICPFLDARKKEVYAALFRKRAGALERLTEDLVSPPARVIRRIQSSVPQDPCLFIGDGTKAYSDLIKNSMGDLSSLTLGEAYPSTACAVARLGEERVRNQESDSPGALVPLYLRPSEAELKKGPA